MSLKDNPAYKIAFDQDGIRLYVPTDITNYHKSRELAAMAQQIYSESGATKRIIEAIVTETIRICNTPDENKIRTDIGVLMNNLLYRLKYPVDEECSIRMGAILCFMEEENPDMTQDFWTVKKMDLAHSNPDLYAFFLTMGLVNTPAYSEPLLTSINTDYFNKRREMLQGLTLPTLSVK